MKFTQTTVSPALAADYLKRNIDTNRPINKAHVERLTREIREGRWQILPHGIVFDVNGRLIDGQHRLHAIIAANKAVGLVLITEVKSKTLDAIDTGSMRGIHDLATITGRIDGGNAARFAARARVVKVILSGSSTGFDARAFSLATFDEVMESHRASMEWSVREYNSPVGNSGNITRRLRSALVMGAMVVAHQKASESVERFAKKVDTGISLAGDDPAYALRKYLDTTDTIGGPGAKRLPAVYATLRAAYAAIHGHKLSVIRPSTLTRENGEFAKVLKFFNVEEK
jgi:hypothetical protein